MRNWNYVTKQATDSTHPDTVGHLSEIPVKFKESGKIVLMTADLKRGESTIKPNN